MTVYFISDIHLGLGSREEEKKKENEFLAFLKHILPTTEQLFIAGDLFDFWFEYATVIPKGFHRTLAAIQEFTERKIPVHFLAGNHDFWMRDFFQTELGVQVYREPFVARAGGKTVYLHHGDGLAANDLGYRLIKPILRNRFAIAAYRWLHPDFGVRLARGSSRTSRQYTSTKNYGEEEALAAFAGRKIREGIDIVVMGHRHAPVLQEMGGGVYVNLGDWISHRTYGELSEGIMKLRTWNDHQSEVWREKNEN